MSHKLTIGPLCNTCSSCAECSDAKRNHLDLYDMCESCISCKTCYNSKTHLICSVYNRRVEITGTTDATNYYMDLRKAIMYKIEFLDNMVMRSDDADKVVDHVDCIVHVLKDIASAASLMFPHTIGHNSFLYQLSLVVEALFKMMHRIIVKVDSVQHTVSDNNIGKLVSIIQSSNNINDDLRKLAKDMCQYVDSEHILAMAFSC